MKLNSSSTPSSFHFLAHKLPACRQRKERLTRQAYSVVFWYLAYHLSPPGGLMFLSGHLEIFGPHGEGGYLFRKIYMLQLISASNSEYSDYVGTFGPSHSGLTQIWVCYMWLTGCCMPMLRGSFYFLHVDEERRGAKLVRADNFGVTRAVGGLLHLAQPSANIKRLRHFHTMRQEAAKGKLKNEVVLSSVRVQRELITSVWGKSSVAALVGLSHTLHAHWENAQRMEGGRFMSAWIYSNSVLKLNRQKRKLSRIQMVSPSLLFAVVKISQDRILYEEVREQRKKLDACSATIKAPITRRTRRPYKLQLRFNAI